MLVVEGFHILDINYEAIWTDTELSTYTRAGDFILNKTYKYLETRDDSVFTYIRVSIVDIMKKIHLIKLK